MVPLLDVEREPLREPGLPDGSLLLELELDGLKGGELEDRARAGTSRSEVGFRVRNDLAPGEVSVSLALGVCGAWGHLRLGDSRPLRFL